MAKQTIIRFADNELTLLRGSARGKGVQVDLCVREALPEGAMINGLVTDAGLLGEALEALRQKAGAGGKAKLVIDGGQLMMKALSAPKLTEKQLLNVTRSELEELGTAGRDMVYTYAETPGPLAENGKPAGRDILCCGAERGLLEQYVEAAEGAGWKVTAIETVLGSCIRMAEFLPTLAGQSFILVTLDGNTEVTYLFSGGRYLMSSRSRILEPRGTTAVMGTVLGHVSTMQQFSQGQKNTEPARVVYFAGLEGEEEKGCKLIEDTLGLAAGPLPGDGAVTGAEGSGFSLAGALAAAGALAPVKRRTADLYGALRAKKAPAGMEKKSGGLPWAVPIALAAVLAVGFGALLAMNLSLRREIAAVQKFTQDPENVAIVEQVQTDRQAAGEYDAARAQAEYAARILESVAQPDDAMLARAEAAGEGLVGFAGYDYAVAERRLTYSCTAADYRDIPGFVSRMQATGDYEGVAYSSYTQGTGGGYVFTLTCTVKEKEAA